MLLNPIEKQRPNYKSFCLKLHDNKILHTKERTVLYVYKNCFVFIYKRITRTEK